MEKKEEKKPNYFFPPLTSSVISVAMDLPISWYWGPFPCGPKSRKRNLKKKKKKGQMTL